MALKSREILEIIETSVLTRVVVELHRGWWLFGAQPLTYL
jgi:hypothetical protein